jgi:tRNA-binding EMAP/Myf-like protein
MSETPIVSGIKKYLDILEKQGKLVYQRNNTGAVPIQSKGGTRFIRFGKIGSHDFYIFVKHGMVLSVEIKDEKGKQSEGQIEFQQKLEKLDHSYFVVRSLDDIVKILKKFI